MEWHEKDFNTRFNVMGDIAEEAFREWCFRKIYKSVRFGFDRPDLEAFWWLPKMIRYMPDFIVELPDKGSVSGYKHNFVEAKGCGKDRVVKIKLDDLWALNRWDKILPVMIYAYYNVQKESRFTPVWAIKPEQYEKKTFGDNKKVYICIPFGDDVWRLEL